MSINLIKGQKTVIGSKMFQVGLGWPEDGNMDLDVSVFMLNQNKVIPTEEHFIFYNNLKSPCGTLTHSGDCRNGKTSATGDDETITVDLNKVTSDIVEMLFVVTIDEAVTKRQNFGMVRNSYIRILDEAGNQLVKYELDEDFSIETGVVFGRLYLKDSEWKFDAMGIGYQEDLSFFVQQYYTGSVAK